MTPIRCLVTGAAGDIGQAIGNILRGCDLVGHVVGADVRADHPGPAFFDDSIQLPLAASDPYGLILAEALERHDIQLLIPTSEAELGALLSPRVRDLIPARVKVAMASPFALQTGLDKLATAQHLASHGLGVPWTVRCGDGLPPSLPCIVKPRRGQGSKGIAVLETEQAAASAVAERPEDVFQDLLLPDNEEYTCALFRSAAGELRTLVFHRVLANGFSVRGSVVDPAPFQDLLEGIAVSLDLNGAINVQCRLTDDGPKVFEINPRFSSTVEMRHLMGFSDVVWSLQDLFKLPLSSYQSPTFGQRFYRASRAIILPPLAE